MVINKRMQACFRVSEPMYPIKMGDTINLTNVSLIIEIKEIFLISLLSLKNRLMSYESESVSLSVVSDSATPWTVAHQTPLVHGVL